MSRNDRKLKQTLDPEDWDNFRHQSHQILDAMLDDMANLRDRYVWKPMAEKDIEAIKTPIPLEGKGLAKTFEDYQKTIRPFPYGINHPRFWGWVNGAGTAEGMIANLVSAGFHSPNILHNHGGFWIEVQVLEWFRELFQFPKTAKGNFVSGGSMANLIGLAVARFAKLGGEALRERGLEGKRGLVYGSAATHYSIAKGLDFLGQGQNAFVPIPVDQKDRVDLEALKKAIKKDREQGFIPYAINGNAGTVGTGAIDNLNALADLAKEENLWLHIDGAFGAIPFFSKKYRPLLKGLNRADSLAFDLHKWLHQPYEVGCILVRDGKYLEGAFRHKASYIRNLQGTLSDVPEIFSERGLELSRGLRSFPFWFSIKSLGLRRFVEMVEKNISQAQKLATFVKKHPSLENLAPVGLCVVNFRYRGGLNKTTDLNLVNEKIITRLHQEGIAVPSLFEIDGKTSIRVCITNHRTLEKDLKLLIQKVVEFGSAFENRG